MAKSIIKIYKTELMPEKNFKIEGIQDYLDEYCTVTYSNDNFQYIQLKADIEIKINNFQSLISELNVGNYVSIEQDNRVWYYFILSYEWKSKKTIKLYLSLDSVNTLDDIIFNDKTTVYREHRSRATIDNIPEGIQPIFYKVPRDDDLILEDGTHKDWFLIYKNHTENTDVALDCFLCTSDNIHVIADASKSYINISKLKIGYTYIVDGSIKVGTKEYKADYDKYNFPYIYKTADKLEMNMITGVNEVAAKVDVTDNIEITSNAIKARFSETFTTYRLDIYNFPLEPLITVPESSFIKSIDEIDRTDLKLNKIMRLPYCPVDYTYNDGIYSFDTEKIKYNNTENLLQIKDLNMKFSHKVTPNPVVNPFPILWKNPSPINTRDDNYENKLYSSEFYQPRFIYDSFVYTFALEDISQIIKYDNLVFNYVHTSTINSKSLIDFYNFRYKRAVVDYPGYLLINRNDDEVIYNSPYINYIKNGINYDKRDAKFNFWTGIASNLLGVGGGLWNQLGSRISSKKYASSYGDLRYLQDYEIPKQEAINQSNLASGSALYKTGLNKAGYLYAEYAKAKALTSAYEGQSADRYGKAFGISSIAGAISGIASNILSRINAEMTIEQNKEQSKNQAVSVYGADDIDLLKVYSKNKAKLSIYKTSDTMKYILGNLFYYTGYNSEGRQYKPDIDSRYWFNFLQCDLEIPYGTLTGVPNEYLDDLRIRYNKGVTIFHKHITPSEKSSHPVKLPNKPHVWNIDQTLENAEINNIYYDVTGKYVTTTNPPSTKFTLSLTLNSKPVGNILEQYNIGRISVGSDEFLGNKYYMTYDETTNTYSFTIDKAFNNSELEIYLNKEDSSGNIIARGLKYFIYKSEE